MPVLTDYYGNTWRWVASTNVACCLSNLDSFYQILPHLELEYESKMIKKTISD